MNFPTQTVRVCISQSPSCTGLNPCTHCHAAIMTEVIPVAMRIANSLHKEQLCAAVRGHVLPAAMAAGSLDEAQAKNFFEAYQVGVQTKILGSPEHGFESEDQARGFFEAYTSSWKAMLEKRQVAFAALQTAQVPPQAPFPMSVPVPEDPDLGAALDGALRVPVVESSDPQSLLHKAQPQAPIGKDRAPRANVAPGQDIRTRTKKRSGASAMNATNEMNEMNENGSILPQTTPPQGKERSKAEKSE